MPTFRFEGLAGIHDNFALEPKNLCSFPLTFENFINQKEKKKSQAMILLSILVI